MKKLLPLLFAFIASVALAQSYPNPNYNNLTVHGTFTAPYSITLNNPAANTYGGKLNQIVNMTDFSPTCNGSTNDDAAVSAAITAIGSTPVTLMISCPLKIAANHTFAPGTQLDFESDGEFIGTAGTEVIQVQQQILAGRTQLFSNLAPLADVGMTIYPEWFGGNTSVSDASTGFNKSYGFLANVGGAILMAPGTYSFQNSINNVKSNVALIGAGQFATQLNFSGTNTNGISAAGVLGTPLNDPTFASFSMTSSTAGTSNTGIALNFTALAKVADVQVNNFFVGIGMECATNSSFNRVGTTYAASTNGFTGWSINGGGGCTGGNESSTWRDTYVAGTGAYNGPTGQIGYHAYGAYVSDLYFSNAATAETNYGYYLDYLTAAAGGYADVAIHNPVVDGFTTQGIFVNALPAQQMITISDGWLNPVSMIAETDGLYVNSAVGSVQANGMQIGGEANYAYAVGARIVSSTDVKITGSAFNDNKYHIEETGSSRDVYSNNSFYNTSAHAGTVQVFLTGSTGTIIANDVFDGTASIGVQADATSSGVQVLAPTFASGITTQVQNSGSNPIGGGYTGTGLNVLATAPVINGVTAGTAAAAGVVGQVLSNSSSGTTITTGLTVNATSLSVTPGDWLCWGNVTYLPTASTVVTGLAAGITTTSATLPSLPNSTYLGVTLTTGVSGATTLNPTLFPFNISATTTLYLVAEAGSVTGGSGLTVNGYLDCLRTH